MNSAFRVMLTLAVLLLGHGASARSQDEFDRHVAEAQRAYAEQNYDKSIDEFSAAYQLDPEPVLLISIGRCHFKADRPKEALTYYNQALQGKLTRSEREEAVRSVATATIKLQEQERTAAAQQRAADQAQLAALVKTVPQNTPERKPFYKTGWFWGTIGGVTAASLAIGLGLGLGLSRGSSATAMPMEPAPGDNIFPPRSN